MTSRLERIGPPALVLALALARLVFGDPFVDRGEADAEQPRDEQPEPEGVSEAARAILDDLDTGDEVGGLEVVRIGGPRDGEISVELRGARCGARVWITRRGRRSLGAPSQTRHFDLLYGDPPPGTPACSSARSLGVVQAIAARIEVAGAEPPAEM